MLTELIHQEPPHGFGIRSASRSNAASSFSAYKRLPAFLMNLQFLRQLLGRHSFARPEQNEYIERLIRFGHPISPELFKCFCPHDC
jgi:hypothetical protein